MQFATGSVYLGKSLIVLSPAAIPLDSQSLLGFICAAEKRAFPRERVNRALRPGSPLHPQQGTTSGHAGERPAELSWQTKPVFL